MQVFCNQMVPLSSMSLEMYGNILGCPNMEATNCI